MFSMRSWDFHSCRAVECYFIWLGGNDHLALHIAVAKANTDLIKLLLVHGADCLTLKNDHGHSVMDEAKEASEELVKVLQAHVEELEKKSAHAFLDLTLHEPKKSAKRSGKQRHKQSSPSSKQSKLKAKNKTNMKSSSNELPVLPN